VTFVDKAWLSGGGYDTTNILATSLAETIEFQALVNQTASPQDLTGATHGNAYNEAAALLGPVQNNSGPLTRKSLVDAIPELFQNATISMASVPSLQ
jgi:hypothetical protein